MKEKLYFIPGLMCDERLWQKLSPALNEQFECIHVPIPLKTNFDEIAHYLNDFFEEEKINLIGFSLGGYISAYFAFAFPHRVNKLTVISATLCNLNDDEIHKRKITLALIEAHGFKGLSRKKVVSLLDEENVQNDGLIELIQTMYADLGKKVFTTQLGSTLVRHDLSQKLSSMQLPMMFIYANQDRLINQSWMSEFMHQNPSMRFECLDSTSHMLPLEKVNTLSAAIKSWYNKA